MAFRRGLTIFLLLSGWTGSAMEAPSIPQLVMEQVLASDSIRAQTLQLLARGQVSEAIDVFKMPGGRDMRLTETGYHVLVRMNDRAYDAYTGAAGMLWAEYLSRVGTRLPLHQTVVDSITRTP